MTDVLKGWAHRLPDGVVVVYPAGAGLASEDPVLLVPDDGSYEKMRRDHEAMERLRKFGLDWELRTGYGTERVLHGYPSRAGCTDPAGAILATEGGDK